MKSNLSDFKLINTPKYGWKGLNTTKVQTEMIVMNIKIKEALEALGLMITIIIKMNSDFKSNQSFLEAF